MNIGRIIVDGNSGTIQIGVDGARFILRASVFVEDQNFYLEKSFTSVICSNDAILR